MRSAVGGRESGGGHGGGPPGGVRGGSCVAGGASVVGLYLFEDTRLRGGGQAGRRVSAQNSAQGCAAGAGIWSGQIPEGRKRRVVSGPTTRWHAICRPFGAVGSRPGQRVTRADARGS